MSALRVGLIFLVSLQVALWIVTADPRPPAGTLAHRDPPESLGRVAPAAEPPSTTWRQARRGLEALAAARGGDALGPAARRQVADLLRIRLGPGPIPALQEKALATLLDALRPGQRRLLAAAAATP